MPDYTYEQLKALMGGDLPSMMRRMGGRKKDHTKELQGLLKGSVGKNLFRHATKLTGSGLIDEGGSGPVQPSMETALPAQARTDGQFRGSGFGDHRVATRKHTDPEWLLQELLSSLEDDEADGADPESLDLLRSVLGSSVA